MNRIKCDLRTHTFFTAGADSTITDNIYASAERGIELLALTDSISALCLEADEEFDEGDIIHEADSEGDDGNVSNQKEKSVQIKATTQIEEADSEGDDRFASDQMEDAVQIKATTQIEEADSEADDRIEAKHREESVQIKTTTQREGTVQIEDAAQMDDDSDSQPQEDFFLRSEGGVRLLYGCEVDIVSPEGYLLGVGLPIKGGVPISISGTEIKSGSASEAISETEIESGIATEGISETEIKSGSSSEAISETEIKSGSASEVISGTEIKPGATSEVENNRRVAMASENDTPPIPGGMDFIIAGVNPKWTKMKISKAEATQMYIDVISDRRVLMLANLCRTDLEYDVDEVLKTCKALNKPVEIDERSFEYGDEAALRIRKLLVRCAELGVMICADSGAMHASEVGMIPRLGRELEETDFPESLIMNIDSTTFLERYNKASFQVIKF